jgi:hypothetical protein
VAEYQERQQRPGDDNRIHTELPGFDLGHKEAEEEEAILICGWRDVAAHEEFSGDSRYEE